MLKINYKIGTITFSILHLIFDGLCAYLIFSSLYYNKSYQEALLVFLFYNTLAFCFQPLFGALIDKYNSPQLFLIISVIFLAIGYAFKNIYLVSTILIGIANAIFHIAGGKFVIEKSHNDIASLGLFVAPGAIGLALGQLYPSNILLTIFWVVLAIGVIFICLSKFDEKEHNQEIEKPISFKPVVLAVMVIFVVFLRAYGGKIIPTNVSLSHVGILLSAIFVACGKAAGGFLSKRFGIKWIIMLSLSLSILLMALGLNNQYYYMLGLFCFNFTMPVTLYYLVKLLKNHHGLAFGLLASVLFPGYLLGMLEISVTIRIIIYTVLCLISAIIIYLINRKFAHD